jgi:dihydrofolate reductase
MMNFPKTPVVIVAAINKHDRSIGLNNELLWHIPDDLKRFKELTLGHPIIMGRKTFESILAILGKPLPGRQTIVVTSDPEGYAREGIETAGSLEAAFAIAERLEPEEIHIGGGAQIYEAAMPYVDKMYLTLVDDSKKGDAFFPDYNEHFVETKRHGVREHEGIAYEWVDYIHKKY